MIESFVDWIRNMRAKRQNKKTMRQLKKERHAN